MRVLLMSCALLSVTALHAQIVDRHDFQYGFVTDGEGKARGSYLGIGLSEVDADRAKALKLGDARGVEVLRVEEGSPAEKSGIKVGDVLLSYNGESVVGAEQLGRLVHETPEARKIKVQLWRSGQTETLTVVTEARKGHPETQQLYFRLPEMPEVRNWYPPDMPGAIVTWRSPSLGVECEPVDSQLGEYFGVKQGVLVRSVAAGSAGAKAGLKAGDILTKVGDHTVVTPRDLSTSLRSYRSPSKPISVSVLRDRKEMKFNITPDNDASYNPFGVQHPNPVNQ